MSEQSNLPNMYALSPLAYGPHSSGIAVTYLANHTYLYVTTIIHKSTLILILTL